MRNNSPIAQTNNPSTLESYAWRLVEEAWAAQDFGLLGHDNEICGELYVIEARLRSLPIDPAERLAALQWAIESTVNIHVTRPIGADEFEKGWF